MLLFIFTEDNFEKAQGREIGQKKARLLVSSNIKEFFTSVLHIYFKMIPDYTYMNLD